MGNENPVCYRCEHCKITIDKHATTRAKCFLYSKRGKTITWAVATYKDKIDALIGMVGTQGYDRLREILKEHKTPCWCKKNMMPPVQ